MQLFQPIDQIIRMISAAQNDNVKQLEIEIGYINTENINKLNANNIHSHYTKGDCLCFSVKQILEWNQSEYIFKLIEQKRDEIEILHDVIRDLQSKIQELVQTVTMQSRPTICIGKWASTMNDNTGWVQWNVVKIKPTLKYMISAFTNNNKDGIIGIAGLYRIIFRFMSSDSNSRNSNRWSQLYINGVCVAQQGHFGGNSFGEITDVVALQIGDTIKCNIGNRKGNSENYCALIIERLG